MRSRGVGGPGSHGAGPDTGEGGVARGSAAKMAASYGASYGAPPQRKAARLAPFCEDLPGELDTTAPLASRMFSRISQRRQEHARRRPRTQLDTRTYTQMYAQSHVNYTHSRNVNHDLYMSFLPLCHHTLPSRAIHSRAKFNSIPPVHCSLQVLINTLFFRKSEGI